MMEYENEGNDAFTARAKKKNNGGLRNQGRARAQGKKGRVTHVTRPTTMLENVVIRRILLGMMTTTTTTGRMAIKGTTGSKERGRLPLVAMEMGNLSKGQEIPGMRNKCC